jgi:hypothetical protein
MAHAAAVLRLVLFDPTLTIVAATGRHLHDVERFAGQGVRY